MNETTNVTTVTETPKVNKSKLIVAAFKVKGLDTPANDVIDFVKSESGVEVGVSLVNNLRYRLRQKKQERKAKRTTTKSKPAPAVTTPAPKVSEDPLDKLFAVKEFAAKLGGLNELKTLVDKLERLAA